MTSQLRTLLHSGYIPFGSQYYRAPSPSPENWERDLKNFVDLGFNTVKFWIQWRWNHPEEKSFDFKDIDRLMDLAQENKLRVMLNTIVDVAPAWIYRKYPDASMVTLDGRQIGPQTQPHRQIGGLGVCLNHAAAMDHLFHFLRTAVRRYAGHPALELWNVGSEPELTSSMAELRLYAEVSSRMGDMLCYCRNCFGAFISWLRIKYRTIEALNVSWNRNYRSFEEIELPKTRNTFNDMIDWRMCFVYTLGEHVRRRFDVARDEDRGRHPLMCHHVFIQGFPVTSTANDPWNVGQYGDLHGFTQMDDPMMADVLRCSARGKPVISAEMLMLFGYTLDLPKPIDLNDIKRYVFTGVAANLKGFIFWQYRPELLGREAPAWGLTWLDGSPTPWLRDFAEVNGVLQRNADFLLNATPSKARVALLYNPENQIFAWMATGSEKTATDSLLGVHQALYERNHVVDFIHAREIDDQLLKLYDVIYVPFPYCLTARIAAILEKWVHDGGTLIGESYFAGWEIERGTHASTVPGYGFHEVFKARQAVVAPADSSGEVRLIVKKNLVYVKRGQAASGMIVKEVLIPEGSKVLATFSSGEPAITMAKYGKGAAILIGTYLGLSLNRLDQRGNADLIASLVELGTRIARPMATGKNRVRIDLLSTPKNDVMVIVRNLEERRVETTLSLPGILCKTMREQFGKEVLRLRTAKDGVSGRIRLRAKEVKVFRA